jgi:hypothetical protein
MVKIRKINRKELSAVFFIFALVYAYFAVKLF